MSQTIHLTEAIILRVIPFKENDQILFLFTPDAGLIKVFLKGYRMRKKGQGVCMPLNLVEVSYKEKKGEIFDCQEITTLESFPFLRKELLFLEVACDLSHAVLSSQCVGRSSPQLYSLFLFYLKKIPQTSFPWVLASSFRLKLLKHDGLVIYPMICQECQNILENEAFLQGGETWCEKHDPGNSQVLSSSELQKLYRLALCQNFQEIKAEEMTSSLQRKIEEYFEISVKR